MDVNKIHTCTGHRAALYTLVEAPQHGSVLSAGGDGWIVEWDLKSPENGRVVAAVPAQLYSLAVLPGTKRLVGGNMNGGLHWIDLDDPEKNQNVQHHEKGVFDLQVFGEHLFSGGGDGVLTRWSVKTARTVESFQLTNKSLRSIALAPGRGELAVGASDGAIYFLDINTLELRQVLKNAHDPAVFSVRYTPDEQYLISGGRDAHLRIWDMENNQTLLQEHPAHLFTVNDIVFSPDGQLFATASRDKTVKVWSTADFKLLKVLETIRDKGHLNSVNRLLWNDQYLLSCSDDRTLILWEVAAP